jgi:hypothetical protein
MKAVAFICIPVFPAVTMQGTLASTLGFGHTVNKVDVLIDVVSLTSIDTDVFGLDFETDQYRFMLSGLWVISEDGVRPFIGAGVGTHKTEWKYTLFAFG